MLIILTKGLGLSKRGYRFNSSERKGFEKHFIIDLGKPSSVYCHIGGSQEMETLKK